MTGILESSWRVRRRGPSTAQVKTHAAPPAIECKATSLERAFLSEGETGERGPFSGLRDFDFHGGRVGCGHLGGAQHRELGEDLAVYLGDEIVLAARVLAPDLAELNGFDCHDVFLGFEDGFRLPSEGVPVNGTKRHVPGGKALNRKGRQERPQRTQRKN